MPDPRHLSLGEALITTTLLSIYLGSRGTVLAIAAAQASPSLCTGAAARYAGGMWWLPANRSSGS